MNKKISKIYKHLLQDVLAMKLHSYKIQVNHFRMFIWEQNLSKNGVLKIFEPVNTPGQSSTAEPGNSKLFEKQQMVYFCQEFTIEEVIYHTALFHC